MEKNKELVGIAFYRDLTDLLLNEGEVQHRVSKCLKTAFFIKSKDDLFDAILKFKKNKDRYAIVLNDDNDVAVADDAADDGGDDAAASPLKEVAIVSRLCLLFLSSNGRLLLSGLDPELIV